LKVTYLSGRLRESDGLGSLRSEPVAVVQFLAIWKRRVRKVGRKTGRLHSERERAKEASQEPVAAKWPAT